MPGLLAQTVTVMRRNLQRAAGQVQRCRYRDCCSHRIPAGLERSDFGRRAAIDGDRQALESSGTYRDIGEHAAVARKRGEHEDRAATQHLANEPAPQNRASLADADTSRLSLQRQVARRTA